MTAHLTVITSTRPTVLSKSVRRGPDGDVVREGGGLLVEGDARITGLQSLGDLSDLLQELGPAQALTFGLPQGGNRLVLSRAALARRADPGSATTRTRDRFAWPAGPGIMMLDHDSDGSALSRDELVQLIRTVAPELANAAMLSTAR